MGYFPNFAQHRLQTGLQCAAENPDLPDAVTGGRVTNFLILDAAIALFVRLAQRWETAGHAPAQMHQARQATLPKSGKSENGSISVQHIYHGPEYFREDLEQF